MRPNPSWAGPEGFDLTKGRGSVRACPGRLSGLSGFYSKSIFYGTLYGGAERLTAQNGGLRPGRQFRKSFHPAPAGGGGGGAGGGGAESQPEAPYLSFDVPGCVPIVSNPGRPLAVGGEATFTHSRVFH
jgi:hypothetical protein